jgi:hypothetical protein
LSPRTLVLVVLVVAACTTGIARADRGLIVGVSDDAFLWRPAESAAIARDLGLTAFRVTLHWNGRASALSDADVATLGRVAEATAGLRMVVAVVGEHADDAPADGRERQAYCAYAADLVVHVPTVRDVVVWNEANLSYFWRPQFDAAGASAAPASYESLLAHCWDVLHGVRPDVDVITDISSRGNDQPNARTNVSHSPANFVAQLGAAYRASGRTRPIFDTFGEHPYARSADPPWQLHPGSGQISQGDLPVLLSALASSFAGTGQAVPGRCAGDGCPAVWYLEAGYQTTPDVRTASLYTGVETEPAPVPDGDGSRPRTQRDAGAQLRDGVSLASCQPGVGAFFNFLLADEPDLADWQSGVLWADGTRKASYGALKAAVANVAAGGVDCSSLADSVSEAPDIPGKPSAPTAPAIVGAGGSVLDLPVIVTRPARAAPEPLRGSPAVSRSGKARARSPVGTRYEASAAAATATRVAVRHLRQRLALRGLAALQAKRSRHDRTWWVVTGFYRHPGGGGAVAVWLRHRADRWRIAGSARGSQVTRRRPGVPCDLAYAFARPLC